MTVVWGGSRRSAWFAMDDEAVGRGAGIGARFEPARGTGNRMELSAYAKSYLFAADA